MRRGAFDPRMVEPIRMLFQVGPVGGLSDGALLERALSGEAEASEAAFSALVERHGAMVLRVCRRLLRDSHLAEDAFQATFLVLARRGRALRDRESLSGWLHRVAYRTALRSLKRRQRLREQPESGEPFSSGPDPAQSAELRLILDEEINRLRNPQRLPVVLCCLDGLTHEEAAHRLGWPLGTVKSRLARGRKTLQDRLTRRGVAPAVVGSGLSGIGAVPVSVPSSLVAGAVRAARAVLSGGIPAGLVSASVLGLVQKEMNSMVVLKMKFVLSFLMTAGALAGSALALAPGDGPKSRKADPGAKAKDDSRAEETPGRMTVRVTDAKTGEPLEGVEVSYAIGVGDGSQRAELRTGKDGSATVEYPKDQRLFSFVLHVEKPHYVPQHVSRDGRSHPLHLPASRSFALEPGRPLGGIVRDEQGRLVEGANVRVWMTPKGPDGRLMMFFDIGNPKTGADGRWRIDEAPADLEMVRLGIMHPEFQEASLSPSHGLDNEAVLTRGLTVTGRVLDPGGKPVKGARVALGPEVWRSGIPKAETDENGEFTLENCDAGANIINIQSEGLAPLFQNVVVRADGSTPPLTLKLGPAGTIRGRVVDRDGKPVAGAWFVVHSWRNHQSISLQGYTDAEGRFSWTSAPLDPVLFAFGKRGYMWRRKQPLKASDKEQIVTLDPPLVISGRVTDAETGKPIPEFRIVVGQRLQGRDDIHWRSDEAIEYHDGLYERRFDEPSAYFLRFEAPDHAPAKSRAFHSDEASQTLDIALKPVRDLSGIVLGPDGQPEEDASVALVTKENGLSLHGGELHRNKSGPTAKTDADGRFTFPPREGRFRLVALSQSGFADTSSEEFVQSGKLVLRKWGRIEGQVKIGTKPGAGEEVGFFPNQTDRDSSISSYNYTTRTDADGRFVFERVVPGPGTVSRNIVIEFSRRSSQHTLGWQERIEVAPGETAHVSIGGTGRPVVGRVVLKETPDVPLDWPQNDPARMRPARSGRGPEPDDWRRYLASLDPDGRFRIDDVPPGHYTLMVPVNAPPDPRFCGSGTMIGRASLDLTVPEGPRDEPVDVGDVQAELFPRLKVGERAPEFSAKTLDGGTFQLGGHKGKVVLLDFWATWCGPCLEEMPSMKDLQETFDDDPRFEIVGLSCDTKDEAPTAYVRKNPLPWLQVFAGPMQLPSGVGELYHVRGIPSTFLVGPDGRILAVNLRGPALKEAVRKALETAF